MEYFGIIWNSSEGFVLFYLPADNYFSETEKRHLNSVKVEKNKIFVCTCRSSKFSWKTYYFYFASEIELVMSYPVLAHYDITTILHFRHFSIFPSSGQTFEETSVNNVYQEKNSKLENH